MSTGAAAVLPIMELCAYRGTGNDGFAGSGINMHGIDRASFLAKCHSSCPGGVCPGGHSSLPPPPPPRPLPPPPPPPASCAPPSYAGAGGNIPCNYGDRIDPSGNGCCWPNGVRPPPPPPAGGGDVARCQAMAQGAISQIGARINQALRLLCNFEAT